MTTDHEYKYNENTWFYGAITRDHFYEPHEFGTQKQESTELSEFRVLITMGENEHDVTEIVKISDPIAFESYQNKFIESFR